MPGLHLKLNAVLDHGSIDFSKLKGEIKILSFEGYTVSVTGTQSAAVPLKQPYSLCKNE